MENFEEVLDTVDAMIFTGGNLHIESNREALKCYMERWKTELKLIEKAEEEEGH